MNNLEIRALLTRDPRTRRVFRGVFPRDKLPQYEKDVSAYIINTDHSRGPGEHWVCVWFNGQGGAEYFDSFGLPPTLDPVLRFIERNTTKRFTYNKRLLQNMLSSACGLYVMYYVLMKSRGARLSRVQQMFHPYHLRVNDNRVRSLVKNMLSRKSL